MEYGFLIFMYDINVRNYFYVILKLLGNIDYDKIKFNINCIDCVDNRIE